MNKIWASFIKEKILFFRDIVGVCILFLMPVFLIVVMALIQDAPFRAYQHTEIDILLIDQDGGVLGKNIKKGLQQSGQFRIIDSLENKALTGREAQALINKGNYKFSITIPKGASARIISNANEIINALSEKIGLPPTLPVTQYKDTVNIALYFDPATEPSFKNSIKQSLDNFLTQTESKILVERIQQYQMPGTSARPVGNLKLRSIGLKEKASYKLAAKTDFTTNSVQHNVPAWSIFAMFFIAIPLAGNMIQERENGSRMRTLLIPNALPSMLTGKLLFYICVCLIQFYLMTLVGVYLMPLIGLPALKLGTHSLAIFLTALSISLSAVGIGLIAGVIFKTPNQVLNLMVITIVILSALGGIWVPLEIMPHTLQTIGRLSPMEWGLEAVNNIYLRDSNIAGVWNELLKLSGLGLILLTASIVLDHKREN